MLSPKADDGGKFSFLSSPIPLFGSLHYYILVNNNGLLSFSAAVSDYIPTALPVVDSNPFIAVFWTDIHNELTGDIYYRNSTYSELLTRATSDITKYFPDQHFSAQWAFVATWDRVQCINSVIQELCTFQIVLITNRTSSFVLLNYGEIQWIDDGTGALAGLNSGYSTGYYTIPGSLTSAMSNISSTSNVNVPGRWAFKVDQLQPESPTVTADIVRVIAQSGFLLPHVCAARSRTINYV
ncbi:sushi, nidogen and EGF-like domain-containing protein 1 [Discoglossus pictus]